MRITRLYVCAIVLALAVNARAETTTISTSNKWAWSVSTSWINCRPSTTNGAIIGQFICSGYFYSTTTGWIHLNNGNAPTNGFQYTNLGNDWGVNHLGDGRLRGLAWAESTGWVNFEDSGNPTVDLETGRIHGSAWGESIGWIVFDSTSAYLKTVTMPSGSDTDSDAIPDMWELEMTGQTNLLKSGTNDWDNDGLTDYEEYIAGTDPTDKDSQLKLTGLSINGTNLSITWSSELSRLYRIEENEDLTDADGWQECGIGTLCPTSAATTQALDVGSHTQLFCRIKALVPFSE